MQIDKDLSEVVGPLVSGDRESLAGRVETRKPLLSVQDLLRVVSFGSRRKRLSSNLLHEAKLFLRLPQMNVPIGKPFRMLSISFADLSLDQTKSR